MVYYTRYFFTDDITYFSTSEGEFEMIEMDETEYLESALDDTALLLVLLFFGEEANDKLLYKRDAECSTTYCQP